MKKLIPLFCALALLSGCVGPGETPHTSAPSPEITSASPLPAQSPASTAEDWETAEPWWTDVDVDELPTQDKPMYVTDEHITWHIYKDWPEEGLTLYDVTCADVEGVQYVLRKDRFLGELSRTPRIPSDYQCDLSQGDYDGDGAEEYIITIRYPGDSDALTGILTVCKFDASSGWTIHPYSPDLYNSQLSKLLTFQTSGNTVTLICGAQSVSYTLNQGKPARFTPIEDHSSVAVLTPDGDSITAAFGVGAIIDGAPKIFGILRAELVYDGEVFTLQNPHLEEMIGV